VGFGENATGGYNPSGGSNLVVISANSSPSPEQALLNAISTTAHNWIVFDKDNPPSTIAMYRLHCGDSDVLSALGGASQAQCLNHNSWCSANGVSSANCANEFYNDRLDDDDLPIRNPLIDSNTTIDGRGVNTRVLFSGFKIGADASGASTHVSENVIITNLYFEGAGHTEDHGLDPDMLRSTGESHDIWIHQNTFDTTGDSAFDVKVGAYDITISFNRVYNVKRATLHGSSDSRTINAQITTTIHNNAFVTTDSDYSALGNTLRRVPLMRRGQSHIFNNVFYGYRKDILSIRVGGRVDFENNMVVNNLNNSEGDDIEYWQENLLRDFREGGLDITGTYVWFANSSCQLTGSPGSLNGSFGSTPDMLSQYNTASRNVINTNRFAAGGDLADYVFATAGKGRLTPYVSSFTPGTSAILGQAPASCQ
jgi:pectate lyase